MEGETSDRDRSVAGKVDGQLERGSGQAGRVAAPTESHDGEVVVERCFGERKVGVGLDRRRAERRPGNVESTEQGGWQVPAGFRVDRQGGGAREKSERESALVAVVVASAK